MPIDLETADNGKIVILRARGVTTEGDLRQVVGDYARLFPFRPRPSKLLLDYTNWSRRSATLERKMRFINALHMKTRIAVLVPVGRDIDIRRLISRRFPDAAVRVFDDGVEAEALAWLRGE